MDKNMGTCDGRFDTLLERSEGKDWRRAGSALAGTTRACQGRESRISRVDSMCERLPLYHHTVFEVITIVA
jgi:hypothetical protein